VAVPLADIVSYLDELLDAAAFDEGEPSNGLMVDAGRPVTRIAAAVNSSYASIRGAADAGAQLLLVHHTTWQSIDRGLKQEKESALRDAGVSLYGAHAALDCSAGFGNGIQLAALVGLEVEGRFASYAGGLAGVYGRIEGTFAELVDRLRALLGVPVDCWENAQEFGRVAIVTGGGGMTPMLDEARALGCDTYVTGEGSMYTKLFAREVGMNLIFGTHYATEVFGVQALAAHVSQHFGVPWSFVREDPDIL
jgi:dinuclear metal center YbgI/SA1388 family protein